MSVTPDLITNPKLREELPSEKRPTDATQSLLNMTMIPFIIKNLPGNVRDRAKHSPEGEGTGPIAEVYFSGEIPVGIIEAAIPFNSPGDDVGFTGRLINNGIGVIVSINLRQEGARNIMNEAMEALTYSYKDVARYFPDSAIATIFDLSVDPSCIRDLGQLVSDFARSPKRQILTDLTRKGTTKTIAIFPDFHMGNIFTDAVKTKLGVKDPLVIDANARWAHVTKYDDKLLQLIAGSSAIART